MTLSTDNGDYGGWDAYPEAVVDIELPGGMITVGPDGVENDGRWRPAIGESVFVITAWNPGQLASPQANADAQARLLGELTRMGAQLWPATGRDRDRTHAEESIAVTGLTESEAVELGRRYGQDAIFAWSGEGLRIVPCATAAR